MLKPDADAGLLNLTARAYSGNATEVVEDLLDRAEAAAAAVLVVCSLGKSVMAAIGRRQLYFSGALLTVAPALKAVVGDLPVRAAKYKLSATQRRPSLAAAAPAAGAPLWPTSEAHAEAFAAAKGKELLNYNSAAASATGYVLQLAVAEPHVVFPGLSLSLARRLALASASSLLALRLSQLWPVRERLFAGRVLRLGLLQQPGQLPLNPPPRRCSFFPRAETPP